MLSALEQEIIEKFRLLDEPSKYRGLLQIKQETEDTSIMPMSVEGWLEWAQNFGSYFQTKYGSLPVSSADLLNEAREERLNN